MARNEGKEQQKVGKKKHKIEGKTGVLMPIIVVT